jgi:hypothetical protein
VAVAVVAAGDVEEDSEEDSEAVVEATDMEGGSEVHWHGSRGHPGRGHSNELARQEEKEEKGEKEEGQPQRKVTQFLAFFYNLIKSLLFEESK